jgi:hypothetical protein
MIGYYFRKWILENKVSITVKSLQILYYNYFSLRDVYKIQQD